MADANRWAHTCKSCNHRQRWTGTAVIPPCPNCAKKKLAGQPTITGTVRVPLASAAVKEALAICDDIDYMAERVPSAGEDFAMSVQGKAADIRKTIEHLGSVTDGQTLALSNMQSGLSRWIRDCLISNLLILFAHTRKEIYDDDRHDGSSGRKGRGIARQYPQAALAGPEDPHYLAFGGGQFGKVALAATDRPGMSHLRSRADSNRVGPRGLLRTLRRRLELQVGGYPRRRHGGRPHEGLEGRQG